MECWSDGVLKKKTTEPLIRLAFQYSNIPPIHHSLRPQREQNRILE